MKIICLADLHSNILDKDLSGDILIFAGDALSFGTIIELLNFSKWFQSLNFKYKIFIPGNHDCIFQVNFSLAKKILIDNKTNIYILLNDLINLEGKIFLGIPYVKDKCIPKLIQSVMDNGGLNTPLRIRVA